MAKIITIGIDEAGRGPLAGPVVAAAITVRQFSIFNFQFSKKELKDSKQLSAKQREEIFSALKQNPDVEWGIGRVGPKVIDKINILEATKLAMKRAVKNLEKKTNQKAKLLLIDGNFKTNLPIPQKSVIKGDEKVFLIALASIIAKVSRDQAMHRYHKQYSQYGFNQHKGYPTEYHRRKLKEYGVCKIHRKTFKPVNDYGCT